MFGGCWQKLVDDEGQDGDRGCCGHNGLGVQLYKSQKGNLRGSEESCHGDQRKSEYIRDISCQRSDFEIWPDILEGKSRSKFWGTRIDFNLSTSHGRSWFSH